jgi:hypothetical protein
MGKLSSQECARFEEHFVDCPRCLEQLETTEDFRQSLKTVAAEDATRSHFGNAPVSSSWQAAFRWRPALIAVAACLAIFAVPGFVLMRQVDLAHSDLSQANANAEAWHRQYVAEQQTTAELEKQLHEAEQKGEPNPSGAGASAALPAAAYIFSLETTRGAEPAGAEPVNQVVISSAVKSVTLSIAREDIEDAPSYHATLADSHGRSLWLGHLEPLSSNVGIIIPARLLHAGDYLLTLHGRPRQGGGVVSRTYAFRVKFKP